MLRDWEKTAILSFSLCIKTLKLNPAIVSRYGMIWTFQYVYLLYFFDRKIWWYNIFVVVDTRPSIKNWAWIKAFINWAEMERGIHD